MWIVISNHWQLHCLSNSFFRLKTKKSPKFIICWDVWEINQWHGFAWHGNTFLIIGPLWEEWFLSQRASNVESVSMSIGLHAVCLPDHLMKSSPPDPSTPVCTSGSLPPPGGNAGLGLNYISISQTTRIYSKITSLSQIQGGTSQW